MLTCCIIPCTVLLRHITTIYHKFFSFQQVLCCSPAERPAHVESLALPLETRQKLEVHFLVRHLHLHCLCLFEGPSHSLCLHAVVMFLGSSKIYFSSICMTFMMSHFFASSESFLFSDCLCSITQTQKSNSTEHVSAADNHILSNYEPQESLSVECL